MSYRNGTYVAFDGNGTTDPTKGDMKYYGLLQAWNKNKNYNLNFSDSHKKTYQVKDTSQRKTLENRLMERMRNSKQMLLIITDDTNFDRGMLNFEIEKAIDYYKIPIIISYPGYGRILQPDLLRNKWPKALLERIDNNTAKCIHIPFNLEIIGTALSQFDVHNNELQSPLSYYVEDAYKNWGL